MRRGILALIVALSACHSEEQKVEELPAQQPAVPPAAPEGAAPGAAPGAAAPAEAPKAEAKPSAGKIDAIEGKPVILRGEEQVSAEAGAPVFAGDKLKTPAKSKARVVLADESVLAIGADTEVKLTALDVDQAKGRKGSLEVAAGKFWLQVSKWSGQGESLWDIDTPSAVAGVRGTTLWGDTKVDAICSLEGQVEVKSKKNEKAKPVELKAGSCASKLSKGKLAPLKPKPKQVQGYLKEVLIETPNK